MAEMQTMQKIMELPARDKMWRRERDGRRGNFLGRRGGRGGLGYGQLSSLQGSFGRGAPAIMMPGPLRQ